MLKRPLTEDELEIFNITDTNNEQMSLFQKIKEWLFGKKKSEEATVADLKPTFEWESIEEDFAYETRPILPPASTPEPESKPAKKAPAKKASGAVKGSPSTKPKPKKS